MEQLTLKQELISGVKEELPTLFNAFGGRRWLRDPGQMCTSTVA